MKVYPVRDIIQLTEEQLWKLPFEEITIQFDDGDMLTRTEPTVISWYLWDFHRRYPNQPILMSHHIGNGHMTSGTHRKVLEQILFTIFENGKSKHANEMAFMEKLWKDVYEIVDNIRNMVGRHLGAYVTSVNAFDIYDVMDHPEIRNVNDNVKPNTETDTDTVENAYNRIGKVLKTAPELKNNSLAKLTRFGLVSIKQTYQVVGPRGYVTDIDEKIFRKPILTGFAKGMRTLEDVGKESRSASKSLVMSKEIMKDAEYLNRNIQLMAQTISNLHYGDCGSKETISFRVEAGDIEDLVGIYYWSEEKKDFTPIQESDHHLVAKTIHIRSPFTCKHPDTYGVCSKCFGDMALSIPIGSNIGHFSTIVLQSELSQRVLSVKHEDSSASTEDFVLGEFDKHFLQKGEDQNTLFFAPAISGKLISMTIDGEQAKGLHDLIYVEDMSLVSVNRISEVSEITIVYKGTDGSERSAALNVMGGSRVGSLSKELLEYFRAKTWTIEQGNLYTVDMSEWDVNKPIIVLPLKHYSMVDLMKSIEKCLKGTTLKKDEATAGKALIHHDTVDAAIMTFHKLVSSKIRMSMSHLMMIAYTTMIEDSTTFNYYPPAPGSVGEFGTYNQNMFGRSLSPKMAYQGQADAMMNIRSFLIRDRPAHPMDSLLIPYRTV